MTDPDKEEGFEVRVFLTDGSCWISDPDLIDPDEEVEGVLAMQYTIEFGLALLVGRKTDGVYSRKWESPEVVGSKTPPKLSRVK